MSNTNPTKILGGGTQVIAKGGPASYKTPGPISGTQYDIWKQAKKSIKQTYWYDLYYEM